jgi:endonuclease YncB( thermonuclease family)
MLRIALLAVVLALPAQADTVRGTVSVTDGDTIRLGETRVRLHGIDALEIDQTCTRRDGAVWPCGRWARDALAARFGGRTAICEAADDTSYGRMVARCRVGGTDMGAWLVRQGVALAARRYSLDYVDAEKEALFAQRGIWAADFIPPAAFRAAVRAAADSAAAAAGSCVIKGNISANGRIYHLPGQEHYDRTTIRPEAGERWFCTEAEARAAGWRRARR